MIAHGCRVVASSSYCVREGASAVSRVEATTCDNPPRPGLHELHGGDARRAGTPLPAEPCRCPGGAALAADEWGDVRCLRCGREARR